MWSVGMWSVGQVTYYSLVVGKNVSIDLIECVMLHMVVMRSGDFSNSSMYNPGRISRRHAQQVCRLGKVAVYH